MRILILVLVSLSLICNCILGIYISKLYGTINNLKTSLNITNERINELDNKYSDLQESVALIIAKPSNKTIHNSVTTSRFPDYQIPKVFIPDNTNYHELQQQNDKLDSLQKQTDEINKKLRDAEIQKDAERLARPYYMF